MTRGFVFTSVGLAAGFSGVAVLAYILTPASLIGAELGFVALATMCLVVIARRAPRELVLAAARIALLGATVGAVATLVYDATRTVLSLLDPSPYNPFEAIRVFGRGVLPAGADPSASLGAGFVIHLVNGSTFGVIYAMFASAHIRTRRRALMSGMAWGVALELIQSTLYPGWLGIGAVINEFLLISAAGHLAYGATLGLGLRAGLLAAHERGGSGGVRDSR